MPLTPFQKNVLVLLAAHRNPENYPMFSVSGHLPGGRRCGRLGFSGV
jgi:hypothetical protein